MPFYKASLLDTRSLSSEDIHSLFQSARALAQQSLSPTPQIRLSGKVAMCVFFEPSTRTLMSFQMAAARLGLGVLVMPLPQGTSLSKGETLSDTIANILAMRPDVLIVRYGENPELDDLWATSPIPIINAGSGKWSHPTQALLDAYTIECEKGAVQGQKVLIFGDIQHSRVARSNFDVLTKLGAQVGVAGPAEWMPKAAEFSGRVFSSLEEGLSWASVCMGLRVQMERHEDVNGPPTKMQDFNRSYGLNAQRLKILAPDALILHPGPINHGVEFTEDVLQDPRSRILQQVHNGVWVRAALLAKILGL